ncbi:MAG TPA: M48 family metalloprotease [Trichocoleus sp.]
MPQRIWRDWRYFLLALAILLAVGLGQLAPAGAELGRVFLQGPVEAYQLTQLSSADEVALAQAIDTQLKQDGLVPYTSDPTALAYVAEIGQRLVAACGECASRPYTFQVVEDEGVNAFATMGGFVYVQTGLLKAASTEAELAFVLAHEISHIVGRHGVHQLWQELTAQSLNQGGLTNRRVLVTASIQLRLLSRSLLDEYDADERGFSYLREAGYAPSGAIAILRKMADAAGSAAGTGNLDSLLQSRTARLEALLAAVEADAGAGLDPQIYRTRLGEL